MVCGFISETNGWVNFMGQGFPIQVKVGDEGCGGGIGGETGGGTTPGGGGDPDDGME